jgi:parvulin-like peptidyl-prolyl isomerase
VVRTQFGYHIIKSEARRGGETATKEEAADQIREHLQQQKLQQHVQDHVKGLRDQAEVEVLVSN